MYKKIFFFFTIFALQGGIIYSSEQLTQSIISDGYKIRQRPLMGALVTGFKNGAKHTFFVGGLITLIAGMSDNHSTCDILGLSAVITSLGALSGSFTAGVSSLLPIKKEDCSKMVLRQKFINRAGMVSAHTGTALGAVALMLYTARFHPRRDIEVYYVPRDDY